MFTSHECVYLSHGSLQCVSLVTECWCWTRDRSQSSTHRITWSLRKASSMGWLKTRVWCEPLCCKPQCLHTVSHTHNASECHVVLIFYSFTLLLFSMTTVPLFHDEAVYFCTVLFKPLLEVVQISYQLHVIPFVNQICKNLNSVTGIGVLLHLLKISNSVSVCIWEILFH